MLKNKTREWIREEEVGRRVDCKLETSMRWSEGWLDVGNYVLVLLSSILL
jgi:hypothetical protein